jgi:cytidine deaminase
VCTPAQAADIPRADLLNSFFCWAGEEWAKFLTITLSLSDGAPARMAALNASLRPYHPNYLHLWRLKTWWDEDRLCVSDVDFHAFHKLEMRPALPRAQLVGDDRRIVDEMLKYRAQFEGVRDGARGGDALSGHAADELSSFWLRKSRKAVLAVLLTRKSGVDAAPVIYRGMNLEVSMPTGTLCAERNAIGNALANDQSLRREDIRAIAVLSVSLARREDGETGQQAEAAGAGETLLNPLDPCGACMEWLRKIAEVNPDFKVITFSDTTCESAIITPIEYLTV